MHINIDFNVKIERREDFDVMIEREIISIQNIDFFDVAIDANIAIIVFDVKENIAKEISKSEFLTIIFE